MNSRLLSAKKHFRATITSLKIKVSNLNCELEKIDQKFEDLMDEVERYKNTFAAEKVKNVSREIQLIEETPQEDLEIGATIGIFDIIIRAMSKDSDDFRLACESILFPSVFERVVCKEQSYVFKAVPDAAHIVIQQGKDTLDWLREEFETHLTDPTAWPIASDLIADWWLKTALPLLYGSRDKRWDEDKPLSYCEMETWRDSPLERITRFPSISAAYRCYMVNKDEIHENLGLAEFEIKTFSF
jgi:hypothetical protein